MTKKLFMLLFLAPLCLQAMTIEEKRAAASEKGEMAVQIELVNSDLASLKAQLQEQMQRAQALYSSGEPEEEYQSVLNKVKVLKRQFSELQEQWRAAAVQDAREGEEGFALWDQEETTISQLVMEYGSADFLYIVPPEMANVKLAMHSGIPIPRESWNDVLEIILAHNGIGVKAVNTYARQLFIFKQDPAAVEVIAASPQEIAHIEDSRRIFYVFTPPAEKVKAAHQFFERFSDPKQTFVYQIGSKVAIVSQKSEIVKLLDLYGAVWQDHDGKVSRVVSVTKMHVREMEKILQTFFGESVARLGRPPFGKGDQEGLSIVTPSYGNTMVLMGGRDTVDRAEKVVKDTEKQLQDPAEMTIYIYACRHSDPVDLSKILDKVYYSLLHAIPDQRENLDVLYQARGSAIQNPPDGYSPAPPLVVPPQQFKPEISTKLEVDQGSEHFIPDPKTGNLLMVVRRDTLTPIKDLLRRLDIPKRMVQIEVLLFEKKLNNQANYGLNLLRLGNATNGARYDGPNPPKPGGLDNPVGEGILAFLFSGKKSKYFPAFDLAYSFLMTQEDIQLNAAPSVITVNQTPATISILEELSINNGAAPIDTNKGIAFEKAFTRAQYGIQIILTPIIHVPDEQEELEDDCKGFITLQTNITFDTIKPGKNGNDRPIVDKRHIENEVRVYDGQTVILGGLRRKSLEDQKDKVPFLGDIPGFGKLFGSTQLTDNNTEIFFFITPKIISDPKEELLEARCRELECRPGDIPEFLERVVWARECEKARYFSHSFRMLLGKKSPYDE